MTAISTSRLILRSWRESDLPSFAALNADPVVMEHFPKTLNREESDLLAARIQSAMTRHGFGLWAVEVPGAADFIGFVGLSVPAFTASFTPCVEIAWRLARAHWGRGYATEAASATVHQAFEHLRLDDIVSFTVPANARSRRVMESIGMRRSPTEDFLHPGLAEGHPLQPHVLYRLSRQHWKQSAQSPIRPGQ